MKSLKFLRAAAIVLPLLSSAPAQASDSHAVSPAGPASTSPQSAASATLTKGEIRKVDKSAGKVTIKHEEIKNLDMPPMTMVFRVKEPSMLEQIKAGDQVNFVADKVGGQYVVIRIEAGK